MGAGPCGCSCGPVFLNLIRHANPSLKYADGGSLPDLRTVAHRLRTSGLDPQCKVLLIQDNCTAHLNADLLLKNNVFVVISQLITHR